MWFRKKTLQEQIDAVKREAKRREMTHSNANFGYMAIAVDLGLDEAANHFMAEYVEAKLRERV